MTSLREPLAPWIPPELIRPSRFAPAPPPIPDGGWRLPELDVPDAPPAPGGDRSEVDEAYERGRDSGRADGERAAREILQPALETLTRVGDSFEIIAQTWVCDRERDLQGLAVAIARKLVQREIGADPSVVRDLVSRALELMPAEATVEIRINPADLAVVSEDLERLAEQSPSPLRWVTDPTVARGDFLVESPTRIVDGRTDVALRSLYERLDPS